jgi:uncharacterized coiled-coil protein SlyX
MISAEIAVSGYILRPPELPQIPQLIDVSARELHILAQMAKMVAEARELLDEQNEKLEALSQRVERLADKDAEEIERMAEFILTAQHPHVPRMIAALETLDERIPTLSGPVLRLVEESVDIGKTWLELFQNFHLRLIKLASDKRAKTERGSPIFSDADTAETYLHRILAE